MGWNKKNKLFAKWLMLFFISNLLLCWIIGLSYLSQLAWYGSQVLHGYQKTNLFLFIISSFVAHFALLGLFPLVVLLFFAWCFYAPRLLMSLSIVIVVSLITLLLVDVYIYAHYRFHLNGIIVRLIVSASSQNLMGIARNEIVMTAMLFFLLVFLECYYAQWLWRFVQKTNPRLIWLRWYGSALAICLYLSVCSLFTTKNIAMYRINLEVARLLPGFVNMVSVLIFDKSGSLFLSRMGERIPIQSAQMNVPVKYPLTQLKFDTPDKPLNLLIIALDSWRFDMLNPEVTPTISLLAQKSWVFTDHLSGGNATGPGLFSLFYGIPATYWTAMLEQHKAPVLLSELQKTYDMNVISSGTLASPPLNETVFQTISDLNKDQQSGDSPTARDLQVTAQFKAWINKDERLKKPFFTFLLYDSTHSYCEIVVETPFKTEPCHRLLRKTPDMIFARYKNAAYFLDQQVQEVLSMLEARHLLDNTVVIITSDHGEEFDDNHRGYWGHASNYTRYQIKVPLVVYWPGMAPQVFSHQTSHLDIVPTLMTRLLGCLNKSSDYALGSDLLNNVSRLPLIISSYIDFGILDQDHLTRIYSSGSYQIESHKGEVMYREDLNLANMRNVYKEFTYFNQKPS